MINYTALNDRYPEMSMILQEVGRQNPLQKKRIQKFMINQASEVDGYWEFAENLSTLLKKHFLKNEIELQRGASFYNKMCIDFLREQISFQKSGKYRVATAEEALDNVYSNKDVMLYYMVGLLISYMFWPNHYKLHHLFMSELPNLKITDYLEVGVGHGLFTYETLKKFPHLKPTLVDISQTSIEVAKILFRALEINLSSIQFYHTDFLKVTLAKNSYDFIVMGEVLEHVNDAMGFMVKASELLRPNGVIYMTTCANAPAIDHVYHFRNIQEIRDIVDGANLQIIKEIALPADDIPENKWEESLVTINYGCYLKKK